MMIAISTGVGLQQKIREKLSGFNGHIQITNFDNNNSEITLEPVSKNQDFYPKFTAVDNIKNVQVFTTKAGIIRTETDFEGPRSGREVILLAEKSTRHTYCFIPIYPFLF